jgi:hypothetical protein
MPSSMSSFRFEDPAPATSPAVVAEVRGGVATKEALLDELYKALLFPEYFGDNWDAFEECIRDLSWLPAGSVVVKHADLPLPDDVANLKTYLSVMSDAVRKWSDSRERELLVVFPSESRERIDWLLRSAARDAR